MGAEAEIAARLGGELHLFNSPCLSGRGIAPYLRDGESVILRVIGRMHGHELTLELRGQFGHGEALLGRHPTDLIAIGPAFRGLGEIEKLIGPNWNLESLVTQPAIVPNELKGALSPANCARKIPGPLIVLMRPHFLRRQVVQARPLSAGSGSGDEAHAAQSRLDARPQL